MNDDDIFSARPAGGLDAAVAKAPASIGNVAVGFDILGQSFAVAYDAATATRVAEPGVHLGDVSGLFDTLPADPNRNTALRGVAALLRDEDASFGVKIDIDKGVPMSAGMGGSAASAVASVVAANALLDKPLTRGALFPYTLEGEAASSEDPPLDNVAASLFGGLAMIAPPGGAPVTPLPCPTDVRCILIHPDLKAETREGRQMLPEATSLQTAIVHGKHVGNFAAGCFTGDLELLKRSMRDLIAEPVRGPTFPHFASVQKAAFDAGAIACSLSGSGPSVFAWAPEEIADAVRGAMVEAQDAVGVGYHLYEAPLMSPGAELVET
ncbi:MAG: homoserine kinase [Pseudomonadota bacterium]